MKFNYFTTKIPFLGAFSLIFLLASCGSYEYVGYDTDGIYGSDDNRTVEVPPQQQTQVETKNDGTYYKNYFSEKAREYDYALEEGAIFTDIDSYEGDYNQEIDSLDYNKSYAGWGQNNSNVTINVVDSGWNSWGWYDPWVWNDPWMWNSWRWNRPWGWGPSYAWGWNNWGWNVGFGWGWNNWGYGYPYYGYGYYGSPYYNNYYGNYNRRGIAYNAGRRGSYLNRDITGISRANRSTSLRSRSSNQVNYNNRSTRSRTNTRSSSTRSNSPRATTNRRSSQRVSTPRNSTPRVSTPRSSGSNRSSGSVSRSSSSSSRSSGSRSSGSSRSSSRRN